MKEEETLQILKKINNFPNFSQRKLSKELGYSLGKLNYGLKNLEKKGLIKIKNLKEKVQANGKNYFKYLVTNKGKSLHDLSSQDLEIDVELNNFTRKPTFLIAEIGINHNGSILDAKKLIKLGDKVKISFVKDRPGHDVRYALDSKKIRDKLKFRPKTNFKTGIKYTFEWYKNNKTYYKSLAKKDIVRRLGKYD